jgi:uncharacterized protein (DUF58 family)
MSPGERGRLARRARLGRLARLPRAEHWRLPVVGAVLILLAWASVAHASGSSWVEAVGLLAAGAAGIAALAPSIAALRLSVRCTANTADGVIDEPITVELVSPRAMRCTPVDATGPATLIRADVPTAVVCRLAARGRHERLRFCIGTAAPFGLLWWSREIEVALARPLYIAPRPTTPFGDQQALAGRDQSGSPVTIERRPAAVERTGEVRGLRAYAPGDDPRSVHWHASAHAGGLLVREHDRSDGGSARLDVVLPDPGPEADELAGRYLATALALLRDGRRLTICSDQEIESGRPGVPRSSADVGASTHVSVLVSDPVTAARQLACATSARTPK